MICEAEKIGDKVIFGSTNSSFHWERAMVVGRDVLKSDGDRAKEKWCGLTKSRCRGEDGSEGEKKSEKTKQQI